MKHTKLPILLTTFGKLELTNAILLRLFRRELLPSKVKAAQALVRKDIEDGILVRALGGDVYERVKQIARRRTPQLGTRTLDLLHVASALVLRAEMFYTFDHSREKLVKAEGLAVP